MQTARVVAYGVIGTIAVAAGVFFLVGDMLPPTRHFEAEHDSCHDLATVHEALSQPEMMASWLYSQLPEPTVYENRLRWQPGKDEPWLEVRIQHADAQHIQYEIERENDFVVPLELRLEPRGPQDAGTKLLLHSQAEAETRIGRWYLVMPDLLSWIKLPHQTFRDAVEQALTPLDRQLGGCSDDGSPGNT